VILENFIILQLRDAYHVYKSKVMHSVNYMIESLGVASAGDNQTSQRTYRAINYSWGLGTITNNEVEGFSLFKSIWLSLSTKMRRITSICGDSLIIINVIINNNIVGGNIYTSFIPHILDILRNFEKDSLYHIKRELNSVANKKSKEGTILRKGEIKVNGSINPPHPLIIMIWVLMTMVVQKHTSLYDLSLTHLKG